MKIKDYLTFFRWKNLLIIALIQCLIKYVLFQKFNLNLTLDYLHFALLTLSTIFIAIAGYIINDVEDVKADLVNKPEKTFVGKKISPQKANNLFIIYNSIGLLLGFYLAFHINNNSFFIIYMLISLLLFRYAIQLKKMSWIGNLTVSFIIFLSILIVPIFDLVPTTNGYNSLSQKNAFIWVSVLAIFAFSFTWIREITKDLEDKNGDLKINANTLPIILGEKKTITVINIISLLTFSVLIYFSYLLFSKALYTSIYLIIFVALPLLYFMYKITKSNTKDAYHKQSGLLKIIMLLGILSILIYSYVD